MCRFATATTRAPEPPECSVDLCKEAPGRYNCRSCYITCAGTFHNGCTGWTRYRGRFCLIRFDTVFQKLKQRQCVMSIFAPCALQIYQIFQIYMNLVSVVSNIKRLSTTLQMWSALITRRSEEQPARVSWRQVTPVQESWSTVRRNVLDLTLYASSWRVRPQQLQLRQLQVGGFCTTY